MEQNSGLDSSIRGQDSTTSSAENNVMAQHDHSLFSSSHGTKRRNSQLSEANCGPDPKRSNETNETFSTDSGDLLSQLNQMQKECEKKDEQLKLYSDYINALKSKCAEKDTLIDRLKSEAGPKVRHLSISSEQSNLSAVKELQERCSSKEVQLAGMESKIKQLEAEVVMQGDRLKENASQLQLKSDTIHELQSQSNVKNAKLIEMGTKINQLELKIVRQRDQLKGTLGKITKLKNLRRNNEKQLADNKNLIDELQALCDYQKYQLAKKEGTINDFRTRCNDKDFQLAEKTDLIKRLEARRVDTGMQIIPQQLEKLENKVNSHFDTLVDCAKKCLQQKQYVKANVYYKEAINFEQSTQERSDKLAMLFVDHSFCYGELKSYQQEIDAASSALQYDPDCVEALHNRAFAYFNLEQYSNVCHDLEKALRLNPDFEYARKLLSDVQNYIDKL